LKLKEKCLVERRRKKELPPTLFPWLLWDKMIIFMEKSSRG